MAGFMLSPPRIGGCGFTSVPAANFPAVRGGLVRAVPSAGWMSGASMIFADANHAY